MTGLLDPIQADFIPRVLGESDRSGVEVVVIRVDSGGSVLSKRSEDAVVRAVRDALVPVAAWIGPSEEARAGGGARRLVEVADVVGTASPGRAPGVVAAATLGDFLVELDGRAGIELPTDVVREGGRPPQRRLASGVQVSFAEPSFPAQVLHAVATPTAAYLLLTIALLLILFEFFTGGIGVASGVALAAFGPAVYGLGVLPTRPLALAAVALGILGHSIDVQAGAPRTWTVIGTASFAAGSFYLFGEGLRIPLPMLVVAGLGALVFSVAAMPSVMRARYSTPTIGRDAIIGEEGTAQSAIDPEGVVVVRGAPWRARTNRATPLAAGQPLRVAGVDGLVLEVEPLEGAASDHRG